MTSEPPVPGVDRRLFHRVLNIVSEGADARLSRRSRAAAIGLYEACRPWAAGDGTQGLGIAEKVTGGNRLRDLALKVYVERKLPLARCRHPVPPQLDVPGTDRRVPTDVEEIGRVAFESGTGRLRPAVPGLGISHSGVALGTLGCLVRRRGEPGGLYILSTSHVLADHGLARVGDDIVQPAAGDGGTAPGDRIAELADWVAFDFSVSGYPNLVDAALARVIDDRDVAAAILEFGIPTGAGTFVRRTMRVHKTGRTTGHTTGIVRDVNFRLSLPCKRRGGGSGRVGLRDQVLCSRFTDLGDSGAAVLNHKDQVVGLHVAGSPSTSIFCRIGHVLEALRIELVTGNARGGPV